MMCWVSRLWDRLPQYTPCRDATSSRRRSLRSNQPREALPSTGVVGNVMEMVVPFPGALDTFM